MRTPLRVLLVEDSTHDVAQIVRQLRQAGYEPEYETACTPDGMRAALRRDEWNVVLSDYHLPGFGSLDALRTLRASGSEAPLIVLGSGAGEEAAVAAIRAGADDWVSKDRTDGLGPAIERALGGKCGSGRREPHRQANLPGDILGANQTYLEEVIRHLPVGVILAEAPSGKILFSNPAVEQIWRRPALPSQTVEQYGGQGGFHPDGRRYEPEEWPLARCVQRGEVVTDEEIEILRGDGSRGLVAVDAAPIHNRNGNITAGVVIFHDITERKQAEAQLTVRLGEIQALYATAASASRSTSVDEICEAALDGLTAALRIDRASVLLYDADGVMRFKAWRGLSGPYRNAVEGHSPWARETKDPPPLLVPDVLESAELQPWREVFVREGVRALGFIPLTHRGQLLGKFMLYYNAPHSFRDEEVHVACTVARHIGFVIERLRTEEQLRQMLETEQWLRAESEHLNRLKDDFLATVSHELRTPLTAILGWSRLLQSGRLSEDKRREAIDVIARSSRAQAQVINDLLDVSRVVTGKMKIEAFPVDVERVVERAIEAVRPAAEAKGIQLRNSVQPGGVVLGDADRLQQVIWNLLSNAIKFTGRGGQVQVGLKRTDSELELAVSDTGRGIAPDFLPHLFQRFRQADSSITREHGGLGLGLAIVKHLVELHGGSVEAYSQGVGLGATFLVRLPAIPENRPEAAGMASYRLPTPPGTSPGFARSSLLKNLDVLLVDDDSDSRTYLSAVLELSGARARTAESAQEARRSLQVRPDVLVADIGMPGEDGLALMRQVRKGEADTGTARVPAIALTAYAREEDRRMALEAGYTVHLAKPVEPQELVLAIANLARKKTPV